MAAGTGFLLVLLWGGLALELAFDKAQTTYHASLNVANASQMVDEHLSRVVYEIDQLLLAARQEYERNPAGFDAKVWRERSLGPGGWKARVEIIDADGSANPGLAAGDRVPRVDAAGHEALTALGQSGDDRLLIGRSRLISGEGGGRWGIPLSRRLDRTDGSFAGAVVATVDPGLFSVVFGQPNVGHGGFVAVIGRGDFVIRACTTEAGVTVPPGDLKSTPLPAALADASAGAFLEASPVDGSPQIVGYRALRDYPLIVAIGASKTEILAAYHVRRDWLILAAGWISLAALCAAALLVRQDAGRRRIEAALVRQADELCASREEAERANAAAQTADRAKTSFLAHMSHELRTPLNAILGFSETMSTAVFGPLSERYRDYSQIIHTAGSDLLKIINDILDLSKIEAGRFELHDEEMAVDGLFEGCRQIVAERAAASGLTLEFKPAGLVLRADPLRLKQMLLNLISNAIKFTPPGGRITTSARLTEAGGTTISVRDTGIGIKAEYFQRVLEPFGQVDDVMTRTKEGTGLGLPLVRRLAELHAGQMVLESTPGEGTTVTLIFPPARTMLAAIDATPEAVPAPPGLRPWPVRTEIAGAASGFLLAGIVPEQIPSTAP